MFDTCPTVDETICPDCISGSPGCENNKDGNHILQHIIVIDHKILSFHFKGIL